MRDESRGVTGPNFGQTIGLVTRDWRNQLESKCSGRVVVLGSIRHYITLYTTIPRWQYPMDTLFTRHLPTRSVC